MLDIKFNKKDLKLTAAIDALRSTEYGNKLYERLDSNTNVVIEIKSLDGLTTFDGKRALGITSPKERKGDKASTILIEIDVEASKENAGGQRHSSFIKILKGRIEAVAITIAHELGHAEDAHVSIKKYNAEAIQNGGHSPYGRATTNERKVASEIYKNVIKEK
jgi:hypothetical protein